VRAHYVEYHDKSPFWCIPRDEETIQWLLYECGSFLIPQEWRFGRGDGLQRDIQFWKILANVIETRRFFSQRKVADVIIFCMATWPIHENLSNLGYTSPDSTAMVFIPKAI
jgi:hypothetical protein